MGGGAKEFSFEGLLFEELARKGGSGVASDSGRHIN